MQSAGTTDHAAPDPRPTNMRWVVFALACGTSWMLYLHRYTFGLIKPLLQEEWGLSKLELGLLDSTFFLFYSGFQIPCGVIVDAIGAHLSLSVMILCWSLFLAMQAWAPNLTAMRIALGGFGLAQAGAYPALNRITRNWFPTSVRTAVQGTVAVFCGRMGAASASVVFATIMIGRLGISWRISLYILAAGGVLLALLFVLVFRNQPRGHPLVNPAEADLIEEVPSVPTMETLAGDAKISAAQIRKPSFRDLFDQMNSRSVINLLWLTLQAFLSTLADTLFSSWIPAFLKDVHNLKFAEMGIYSSLPLFGGALGGIASGWIADFLLRRTGNRRWSRSAVGLVGKGGAGLTLLAAMLYYDDPYVFCGLLFLVKFFSDWSLSVTWGTVTDIGGKVTATAFAFINALASIASIVAPPLYGGVADKFGWPPVFYIVAATYLLCAATWLAINCTIPLIPEADERRLAK